MIPNITIRMTYFLHGLMSHIRVQGNRTFSKLLQAVSVPLMGHYQGTYVVGNASLNDFTRDAMESIDGDNCDLLVGSSLGGKIVLDMAEQKYVSPDVPLVLLDIAPQRYSSQSLLNICDFMDAHPVSKFEDKAAAHAEALCHLPTVEQATLLSDNWSYDGWLTQHEWLADNLRTLSRRPKLSKICNPTLIIWGNQSAYAEASPKNKYADLFTDLRTVTVEGSHYPHHTNPMNVRQFIDDWMSSIGRARRG